MSESDPDLRVLSGEIWDRLVERIAGLRDVVWGDDVPDDPVVRAEGARYLLRFLAAGIRVCVELDDTESPELGANIENRMSWGLDNPDCNYSYCRLHPGATYRITGTRGSACQLEFQLTSGHHSDGNAAGWITISELEGRELHVADDGTFELFLSPEPRDGNWMLLDERGSNLLVREFFADWEHEEPAVLLIERIDVDLPPAPLTPTRIASHFDLLMAWLDTGSHFWADFARSVLSKDPGDIQPFLPPAEAAGLRGQAYGMGSFRCEPDAAIILEFEPPDCEVWEISLYDRFLQSIDFDHRQSSLNSAQAALVDGRFVAAICHDDPGVANWLDPGGHREGIIAVRIVMADSAPMIRYRSVARAELDGELPLNIARVGADERYESLRGRRLAVQRRYRR
ncbi:MAG: hypothetical protein EXQ79_02430 [Acidimicrobiia bacterium]|nr:hypothetical protein [Acidimicrobiia bacterium]